MACSCEKAAQVASRENRIPGVKDVVGLDKETDSEFIFAIGIRTGLLWAANRVAETSIVTFGERIYGVCNSAAIVAMANEVLGE